MCTCPDSFLFVTCLNMCVQAVDTVLKHILDAHGDRQRYMQQYWETGKWRLFATAGATVLGACPAR